jgi:hypothetical protein
MAEEISLEEYKKAYREIVTEEEKRGFIIHLAVYLVVNPVLIVIDLVYFPEEIWFFYPLIFWGIGITTHYLNAVRRIEKELKKREAMAEYSVRETKK